MIQYPTISISCDKAEMEAVYGLMWELDCLGLWEENDSIIAYFAQDISPDTLRGKLTSLLNNPKLQNIKCSIDVIDKENWCLSYREFFKSQTIGKTIAIIPPWSKKTVKGRTTIMIEPAMSFGTGTHETTRLALMMLETLFQQHQKPFKSLLDVGCGSGILSIYAAISGVTEVIGVDTDEICIIESRENLKRNHDAIKEDIRIEFKDGSAGQLHPSFDIVLANVVYDIQKELAIDLKRLLHKPGLLILSGLLSHQVNDLLSIYQSDEFALTRIETMGEWSALLIHHFQPQ